MTAPKEVRKFFVPEQMLFNNIDDAFSVDKGAVAFVVDKYDHDTEVQALKADLEVKDERIKQLETRIKGMVLSLQKHGQNIDVKFHIDWLNEALSQKGGKDE